MHSSIESKILTHNTLLKKLGVWRLKSQSIVFTNGVFDLVHPGHVDYLANAAALGDRLVVGINNDASVKMLNKGADRPINSEDARAAIIASLRSVEAVVLFEESTPAELIQLIQPDVLVKGGDYDADETDPNSSQYIVGSDLVRAHGGSVQVIPFLEGFSSTRIIDKIRRHGQS